MILFFRLILLPTNCLFCIAGLFSFTLPTTHGKDSLIVTGNGQLCKVYLHNCFNILVASTWVLSNLKLVLHFSDIIGTNKPQKIILFSLSNFNKRKLIPFLIIFAVFIGDLDGENIIWVKSVPFSTEFWPQFDFINR